HLSSTLSALRRAGWVRGATKVMLSPRVSTSATRPSNQGLASLKNSLTGCEVFTVSIAIRQPLRPRFFAPGPVFPPVGPSGLVGRPPPRLTTTFIPALALFLPRLALPGVAAGALTGLVSALVSDLASALVSALALALPRPPAAGFTAPGTAERVRRTGLRALRRCAALRAAAVRGAIGRRRAGAAAAPSRVWSNSAAMAALTSSIEAMPSTVLSMPLLA